MLLLLSLSLLAVTAAIDPETYTFDSFVHDFERDYTAAEFAQRLVVFEANRAVIVEHNRRPGVTHKFGINEFADLTDGEIPRGYVKRSSAATATSRRRLAEILSDMKPVSELPPSVDWRGKGVTTPVKNQGMCGSCWAFASTAVLESHIAIRTGTLFSLSEQELVSCVENPMQCGGRGGCTGATAELAFDYARTHGLVEEWNFGYESFHGENITCPWTPADSFNKGAVAAISGFTTLPTNNYTAVMNAVAKLGPVAVSVAASPWAFYESGVFSAAFNTSRSTDVNHLVVLEGYGTDDETGEDYWLVRNSWGPRWGENGYIRLKRQDPTDIDPFDYCGLDVTPADGVSCTKDETGNAIDPPAAPICGTSGILYDTSIPLGGYLL